VTSIVAANDPLVGAWHSQGRRLVGTGVIATACAAGALLGWALNAPMAGVVVANGQVRVDTHRKTVQHRDGGTVREILVIEGDRVAAGQPLLVLDDARIDAAHDLAHGQLDAARIRLSRAAAESGDAHHWTLPAEFGARLTEPRVAEAAAREAALFAARRSALDAQLRLVQQQLEALAVAEYQSRIDANEAELAHARQRGSDLELRLASLRETFAQNAAAEQRDASAKIVELEEQWRTARDLSQRMVVTAPVAGRVIDLRVTTRGGSIGPRDPILDIVPEDNPLHVEARVGVDAIAALHAGAHADVRLTAYRQRTTPLIGGTVAYVSPDALADRQTGAAYYLIQVRLDRASLAHAGAVAIQPGMGAEVFVRTDDRTAIEFLLEPLWNASRRSLREH